MLKILHVTNQAKEFLADIIIAEVNTLGMSSFFEIFNSLVLYCIDKFYALDIHLCSLFLFQ